MRISNEMRDRMATICLVYGKPQARAAEELGCSAKVVSTTLNILQAVKEGDIETLENRLVSARCGLDVVKWAFRSLGKPFPDDMGDRLTAAWSVKKREPEDTEAPNEETLKPIAPEQTPTGTKVFIPSPTAEVGWQTRIKTNPGRVSMTIYFNGVPVVEGLSRIKANTELDLMQAISYAAHMCYKLTEQKKLKGV